MYVWRHKSRRDRRDGALTALTTLPQNALQDLRTVESDTRAFEEVHRCDLENIEINKYKRFAHDDLLTYFDTRNGKDEVSAVGAVLLDIRAEKERMEKEAKVRSETTEERRCRTLSCAICAVCLCACVLVCLCVCACVCLCVLVCACVCLCACVLVCSYHCVLVFSSYPSPPPLTPSPAPRPTLTTTTSPCPSSPPPPSLRSTRRNPMPRRRSCRRPPMTKRWGSQRPTGKRHRNRHSQRRRRLSSLRNRR